jgi:hypothetical protein
VSSAKGYKGKISFNEVKKGKENKNSARRNNQVKNRRASESWEHKKRIRKKQNRNTSGEPCQN